MHIRYTQHGLGKFAILKGLGFEVTTDQVEDTVLRPERVIPQAAGRFIAQKSISNRHLLRVVYRMEDNALVVITFYPGRKERYENGL